MSEYPTYLMHFGIRGQKWGERRYQNEDGTYTPEGKERRKIKKPFSMEKSKNGTHPKFANKKKVIRKLSNEEIIRRNRRLELENRYRRNLNEFNYMNSPASGAFSSPHGRETLSIISRAAAIPITALTTAAIVVAFQKNPNILKYLFKK